MKYIKNIPSLIIILVFGYIAIGQIVFPGDIPMNGNICDVIPNDKWEIINSDGTSKAFALPGRSDGDIVLRTYLPDKPDRDYAVICICGCEMSVYVDGELRESLAFEDHSPFGDRTTDIEVLEEYFSIE